MSDSRVLGSGARITRRDFLDAVLVGSGAALAAGRAPLELLAASDAAAAFDGYGGIGDYAGANGNTWAVLQEGHRLRDPKLAALRPRDLRVTDEVDCAIVGGGISGLAAALFLARQSAGRATCLILDNHPIFGGLAKSNELEVGAERLVGNQASALFFPPIRGTFLDEFYRSIGIDRDVFAYQAWKGPSPEMPVGRTCYFGGGPSSAFYFGPSFGRPDGVFVVDPYGRAFDGAPLDDEVRRELLAASQERDVRARWQPKVHGDEAARRLDGMTYEDHVIAAYGIRRETVRRFLSPIAGGGSGVGADAISAYAEYAADVLLPWRYEDGAQMFPGGNSGVARHIVKTLLPDAIEGLPTMEGVCRGRVIRERLDRPGSPARIRASSTVLGIEHEGRPASAGAVRVVYRRNGRVHCARAKSVIVAGGSWTAKHIVGGLPETHARAYAEFHRSPALVAHVAVRNWRFLYDRGIHECRWFEGIGNFLAVRRLPTFGPGSPEMSPDTPVLLTFKILFSRPGLPLQAQVEQGRAELLSTPFAQYERRLRDQLSALFGRFGFDADRDITAIVLNRWGHAYLSPQPGFFFGRDGQPAPGEVLRHQPFGRIAFANSDLSGIMDHRASIGEARRAVEQVRTL
jgi:spermidine dehydrogenase